MIILQIYANRLSFFHFRNFVKCVRNADSKSKGKSRMFLFHANADSIGVAKWNVTNVGLKGPNQLVYLLPR